MKVTSKEKKSLTSIFYIEYMFDTGYKYLVWSNHLTNAYTNTGRYPSKKVKQKMEQVISAWEDKRIQFLG